MDLDFSFALVSSLTPRRKAEKSNSTEVLKKNNSLKTKLNIPSKQQNLEGLSHHRREEKENLIPEEKLMNKYEFLKPKATQRNSDTSNNSRRKQSDEKLDFSINMENIAVRRYRTRGRKKTETNPLQPCDNVLEISGESVIDKHNESNERLSPSSPGIINISSDVDENCHVLRSFSNRSKRGGRKSPVVSDTSLRSSLEVVESSLSEVKSDPRSLSAKKRIVKTRPVRTSGKSETSLSTAYDSDSFQATRRHGTKVIPETPDTDKSLEGSLSEKRKSSILSSTLENNKETHILRSSVNESPKKNGKRKSSEMCSSPEENKRRQSTDSLHMELRPKRISSISSPTSSKNKQLGKLNSYVEDPSTNDDKPEPKSAVHGIPALCDPSIASNKQKKGRRLKKKLRASNESSLLDMFKLESSIKQQPLSNESKDDMCKAKFGSAWSLNDEKHKDNKDNILNESKAGSSKLTDLKKADPVRRKKTKEKEQTGQKDINKPIAGGSNNIHLQVKKNKFCSPVSPKTSTLVLPTEIIPKFEHINKWLKDTQENSLNNDYVTDNIDLISKNDIVPIKNKHRVTLSPRIKKKKEKAKTSLEEEQKLFEELYGAGYEKRLSDDVDEVASKASCQDSVEFSENVLDKLYGTVWQKNPGVVQSEPRRQRMFFKNKTPLTDRKKHRTSIYEVFSSSSSEDRFEEFLENVQRGKVESIKRSGRPGTPEFIKDSSSEDEASDVFYQNIMSSAVKDELNNLKREEIKAEQDAHRINRRRLSFGSSQGDGCSETGRSDTKPTRKGKKSSKDDKTKTKKSRSKKKNTQIEKKGDEEINVFSLVTPLKIKGKTETDFGEKVKSIHESELPRSIGKSKTPKNPVRPKNTSNSEERLKTKYLREGDFKVPKSASKTFKTPSKSNRQEVPSSPALSFLSSLSEMTAGLPCHPDALVYKNNFKTKREELTQRLFTMYNKEVFDMQLPSDLLIQWNTRMTSTSGYCYNKRIYRDNQILRSSRIVLSTKILDRADRLRDTLIHELCHAATWIVHGLSDGHGPVWRSWADKANRRFPELPVIKRCHDYAISTKFTYKCMSCGYSIGRHTKSLDTERKRCGFCFGKFQVFVTAKMSAASVTSGSDSVKTPRNPTGFALFVKDNYAIVKKANNVPHAQVMKLLSQKFAQVKISKQNAEEPILIE